MKKYFVFKHVVTVLLAFVLYYLFLPALNIRSAGFWTYIAFLAIAYLALGIPDLIKFGIDKMQIKDAIKKFPLHLKVGASILLVALLVYIIGGFTGFKLFNAPKYSNLIVMEDGDFAQDVAEIPMTSIPVVDKDTAASLGSRKLGEMSDLVSQFEIASDYTQINVNNVPVRVSPLKYGDIFKWFNNNSQGIPAYIRVDMATQETVLVRLQEGIKYSRSDIFFRNIDRYLRFCYPTKIFEALNFEIDDNGVPYWVAPTVSYNIGIWYGKDISGAVLVNAITGEHQYYDVENIPSWVDRVYDADLVIEQLDLNGLYSGGFWNSVFGQKNVLQTTEGYNYLAINDDVYLYTGITSVGSDESNIGFVLVNLRTKETRFYPIPGAEEYSAMSSAEGQVQNLGYIATFPILLNVSDRPSYFIALKDGAGLVKMYAFVDVQRYQIVGTGNTVAEAKINYLNKLGISEDSTITASEYFEIDTTVSAVASAVSGGNTRYYFTVSGQEGIFIADVALNDYLPFMHEGDLVQASISVINGSNVVTSITITPSISYTPAFVETAEVTE